MIPLSKRIEILQRTGNEEEAKALIRRSRWFRCDKLYYRPSDDTVIDGKRVYKQVMDLSPCFELPIAQGDPLEALAGAVIGVTISATPMTIPRRSCCGRK